MDVRKCLRDPIPEIEVAAHHLEKAVSAHLRGERGVAEDLFRQADDKVVRNWLDSVWGKETAHNRPRRILSDPPAMPVEQRAKPRDATSETKRLIHQRDGHYCRFCKMPVIRSEVRAAICREYSKAVPWGGKNATQHAAFQCMWAQYDHIVPHARGGRSDLDNVYLTCAACNYGRGSYLLEELDLVHPGSHAPRRGDWDGLESFRMAEQDDSGFPVRQRVWNELPPPNDEDTGAILHLRPSHDARAPQAWLDQLDHAYPGASSRLLTFLESLKDLQVCWKINKVLLVQVPSKAGLLSIFGIEPGGNMEVPWFIGPHKNPIRAFAEAIADAIPGAVAYETPKMWSVRKAGRRLKIMELLDAAPEVKAAIASLNRALAS